MDGRMDGWALMDGWTDGWMDGWMGAYGRMDALNN